MLDRELDVLLPDYLHLLQVDSVLADLPLTTYRVSPQTPSKEVRTTLQQQPNLPGVLVVEDGQLLAMVSRRRLLERFSMPYALDVFLRRSIAELPEFSGPGQVYLRVPGSLKVGEALSHALARPGETAYEPLVIECDAGNFRLLDINHLLTAHAHIFELTTTLLLKEQRSVEEREHQIAELRQLNQLKDDFLSTVSHELRTPMTNIKMALYMLQREESGPLNPYLRVLENECDREINLINDLLDLQKMAAGVDDTEIEELELSPWLPAVLEPFDHRARQRDQQLHLVIPPDLPFIETHPGSLERILAELVNNACKYTPQSGLIRVEARPLLSAIQIQVVNSGSWIPPTEWERIFEKFYRIPNSDPWSQGGTGLGLALVKALAHQLGGTLTVESTPFTPQSPAWTTFTLQLPTLKDSPASVYAGVSLAW